MQSLLAMYSPDPESHLDETPCYTSCPVGIPFGFPGSRSHYYRAVYKCCGCGRSHKRYLSLEDRRSMGTEETHHDDLNRGCPVDTCNHRSCVDCRQVFGARHEECWSCGAVNLAWDRKVHCVSAGCWMGYEPGLCVTKWVRVGCQEKSSEWGWERSAWGCSCEEWRWLRWNELPLVCELDTRHHEWDFYVTGPGSDDSESILGL